MTNRRNTDRRKAPDRRKLRLDNWELEIPKRLWVIPIALIIIAGLLIQCPETTVETEDYHTTITTEE